MKHQIIAYISLVILSLSTTICAANESRQQISVATTTAISAPSSRTELCDLLLSRLDAVTTEEGETHPLEKFFSMLGLMLDNSSGMSISILEDYKGLVSVDYSRELVTILKNQNSEQRRGQIDEIYQLFASAAATGDDFNLAALMYSMGKLTEAISKQLFFAGFTIVDEHTSSEKFRQYFLNEKAYTDPDKELNGIADAWTRLAPHHRAAFAEWLGRSFSEGAKTYTTTTIKFTDNKPTSQKICQMLPDLRVTLQDYLDANPGNKREVTKRYYRYMASRLLFIYGIHYSENDGTSSTPALPAPRGLLQRAKQLLLNCR